MKNIFDGRIKVVCKTDKTVFAADRSTLRPLSCSYYDPYPYDISDEGDVVIMEFATWNKQIMQKEKESQNAKR